MKKILSALMLCLVSIIIAGCTSKNAPETPKTLDPDEPTCKVNLETSYATITSVVIYDKSGNVVGTGSYVGTYLVPYYGYIVLDWEGTHNSKSRKCTYTLYVESAAELDVELGHYANGPYISVGGCIVQQWEW